MLIEKVFLHLQQYVGTSETWTQSAWFSKLSIDWEKFHILNNILEGEYIMLFLKMYLKTNVGWKSLFAFSTIFETFECMDIGHNLDFRIYLLLNKSAYIFNNILALVIRKIFMLLEIFYELERFCTIQIIKD